MLRNCLLLPNFHGTQLYVFPNGVMTHSLSRRLNAEPLPQ